MTRALRTAPRPLPPQAHTERPWRIHDIAPDFRLEDVWALDTPGGPADLDRVVDLVARSEDDAEYPAAYRLLVAIRWRLGALLGWDREDASVGTRVTSVRDRLPADLVASPGSNLGGGPFHPVFQTREEYVAEIANRTVHALLHLGWVEDESDPGVHRAQLAVLVKTNGRLGQGYMAFIKPFRYLIVYPAMLRTIARRWAEQEVSAA